MKKTKEELDTLRIEYETLNNKLNELTDEELKQISGGFSLLYSFNEGDCFQLNEDGAKVIVLSSYNNVSKTTVISCRCKFHGGDVYDLSFPAGHPIFTEANYKGRHVFNF